MQEGLCNILGLEEAASVNLVQVSSISTLFDLIYKSYTSLSVHPYPLWNRKTEQSPWWQSQPKSPATAVPVPLPSKLLYINQFAIWESQGNS